MRVFVVGGSGTVGRDVIGLLAPSDLVSHIGVAGRNRAHAEKAAAAIGVKGTAVHADASDEQDLAQRLAGYDLVVNAATDETVMPVLRSAIKAGVHYCDVNLVDEATELTAEAEEAGITAIIRNGIGPGLSNLMGMHVARQLDEVRQLQRGMASLINFDPLNEVTSLSWLHDPDAIRIVLHEFAPFMIWMLEMMQENGRRTMLDLQHGQWLEVDPIGQGVVVPYDGGIGLTYPFASLDSFWQALPTELAELAPMEMWFSTLPPQADAVLREQTRRMVDDGIDPGTAVGAFFDVVDADPQGWLTVPDGYIPVPIMWLRAIGHKDGRPARSDCWISALLPELPGWFLTNAALAAAALKMLHGEVTRPGVMTAEQAFDPESFFDELAGLLPQPPSDGHLLSRSFHWLD